MENRLLKISKALAESAINAYNQTASFGYIEHFLKEKIARKIYIEIVIGVGCKCSIEKLAKLITTVALITYKQDNKHFATLIEKDPFFTRANFAVLSTLKKMINQTNTQRRLEIANFN